jgi:hypothetical protein
MYIWAQNIPNGGKIFQMVTNYIFQHFPFRGPSKYTQIGNFGLKIKPSGNPG